MTGVTRHVTVSRALRHKFDKMQCCNCFEGSIAVAVARERRGALLCSCRKLNNFHFNNFPLPFSLLPFCVPWVEDIKDIPLTHPPCVSDSVLCSIFEYNELRKMRVY